jgi:hypothetical protein
MSLIYRAGAFFFYFGLSLALISFAIIVVFGALFASAGLGMPDVLYRYARIFTFTAPISFIIGVLGGQMLRAVGGVFGVFMPNVAQLSSLSLILTYFVPTYTAITSAVATTMPLLPVPPAVQMGLASVALGFVAFALLYYFAVKVGAAPVM